MLGMMAGAFVVCWLPLLLFLISVALVEFLGTRNGIRNIYLTDEMFSFRTATPKISALVL